jgi:hypothetical protein
MALVNQRRSRGICPDYLLDRGPTQTPPRKRDCQDIYKRCIEFFGRIYMAVLGVPKRLREMWRSFSKEQGRLRKDRMDTAMHDPKEPWTLNTAFHAISGTCVYRSRYTTGNTLKTLDLDTLIMLATSEPETLLPVQVAAAQGIGQASGIVKAITCVQAVWFCSQCIARMNNGLAISLLELNTFAHCISAFFIYGFWWHKPYDVASHAFLESKLLDFIFLRYAALESCGQFHERRLYSTEWATLNLQTHTDYEHTDYERQVLVAELTLSAHEESDPRYLRFTEGDVIPGTGFVFRYVHQQSGAKFFLLEKDSIKQWQELWRFTVECPFDMADANVSQAHRKYGTRVKNLPMYSRDHPLPKLPAHLLGTFVIANVAFVLYGSLHLLAWQYHFRNTAESILWKVSGIITASTGLLVLFSLFLGFATDSKVQSMGPMVKKFLERLSTAVMIIMAAFLVWAWVPINTAARAYLFVESFIALPNSPSSTYQIPGWTAYVPHI